MKLGQPIRLAVIGLVLPIFAAAAFAQTTPAPPKPFEPTVGQPGKDVVWVPTPDAVVEKMLDMAQVTPQDFLIDLGSGDGRTVIAAARRGLRALGIEYNPEMVELARRNAAAAGVGARAAFEKADLFESDFSKAQVITMFLLPDINLKLRPTILKMKPGTRIVSNSFTMDDWQPDQSETLDGCDSWCTAHLWYVPAQVAGTWQTPEGDLTLTQHFQVVAGTLGSTPAFGKVRGEEITLTVGDATYSGRLEGNTIRGTVTGGRGGAFTATRR